MPLDITHNLCLSQLKEWFSTELGQHLIDCESREFAAIVPSSHWPVAVNQGPGMADCFANRDIELRMRIGNEIDEMPRPTVVALHEELPLGRNSADLVVLQHTLDFSEDPRLVLREAIEALRPNGWIIICGFNPFSLWGAVRLMRLQSEKRAPWSGKFLQSKRIIDWLGLLGTEVEQCKYLLYGPPIKSLAMQRRFAFLDILGSWIWPGCAGIYMLSAQKRNFAGHRDLKSSIRTRQVVQALHTVKLGAKLESTSVKSRTH
ncbi:MAG: SAM-dependent methyltransferase [Acidiferrobacteraceae bacterium]|nr:SAM-dependent methyltransferase [Acidiferrobacteraceae bacterium]